MEVQRDAQQFGLRLPEAVGALGGYDQVITSFTIWMTDGNEVLRPDVTLIQPSLGKYLYVIMELHCHR